MNCLQISQPQATKYYYFDSAFHIILYFFVMLQKTDPDGRIVKGVGP